MAWPIYTNGNAHYPHARCHVCHSASYGWTLDLQNPRLLALAGALAPANLRVGGSNADMAVYNEGFPGGGEACTQVGPPRTLGCCADTLSVPAAI